MNPQNENCVVLRRMDYLLNKIYMPIQNFPRPARQVIGQKLLASFSNALMCVSLGNSVKSMRKKHLQEADGSRYHLGRTYIDWFSL